MPVSGIDDTGLTQGLLFDQAERQKQGRLDRVADQVKERFGMGAIRRASSLVMMKHGGQTKPDSAEPSQKDHP